MVEVNSKIRPKLEKLGFVYHDVFALLKDKEENKLELKYCEDPDTFGLHLNNLGYEKWYESLGPLIDLELSKTTSNSEFHTTQLSNLKKL